MFRVETRGHGLLAGGLTLLAGGGAGVAAGFAVGSGGGFGAALALLIISVPSGVVALTGFAMSLVDRGPLKRAPLPFLLHRER